MTLVVAQQKKLILNAVSDTGISQNGMQLPPEKQLPKLCIVSPDSAVGFAGSPELAMEAIASLPRSATLPATIRHFLEFHRAKDEGVDFILMFQRPSLKLIRITNGEGSPGVAHTVWIGDRSAYEHFQRYRKDREIWREIHVAPIVFAPKPSNREPNNEFFKMIEAMRSVLLDRALPHVFGHAVGVNNADGAFEYRPYAVMFDESPSSLAIPPAMAKWFAPQLQELREYSASCFVTSPASHRQGIAFHYFRWKVTFIYHGDRGAPLSSYIVARDMNTDEFMSMMGAEGCTGWSGTIASRLPPPLDYGIPTDKWIRRDRPFGPAPFAKG